MKISIKHNLRLSEVPPKLREELIERFKFPNPKWTENNRMGRWNRGVPKVLKFYDKIRDNGLWIPRGYIRQLIWLCRRDGIDYQVDDQLRSFEILKIARYSRCHYDGCTVGFKIAQALL